MMNFSLTKSLLWQGFCFSQPDVHRTPYIFYLHTMKHVYPQFHITNFQCCWKIEAFSGAICQIGKLHRFSACIFQIAWQSGHWRKAAPFFEENAYKQLHTLHCVPCSLRKWCDAVFHVTQFGVFVKWKVCAATEAMALVVLNTASAHLSCKRSWLFRRQCRWQGLYLADGPDWRKKNVAASFWIS